MATVIALLTNKSQNLAFWISGGFRATTWESVQLVIIVGGIATIISLFLAPKINIVNLGEDVCIGLPMILGREGIENIVEIPLNQLEKDNLHESADALKKVLTDMGIN